MTDAHGQTVRCFESAKAKKTVLQVERLTLALLLVWKCQKPYCRTRAPGELPIEYSVTRGISKLHEHTTSNQPTNLLTSTSSTTLPWGQNAVGTLSIAEGKVPLVSFLTSLSILSFFLYSNRRRQQGSLHRYPGFGPSPFFKSCQSLYCATPTRFDFL